MYKRLHHQSIFKLLQTLKGELFEQCDCFFGGGTAIVLLLGEYRESIDIDLMCGSADGYCILRNIAFDKGLAGFFTEEPKQVRDLKADRYGIRTFVEMDGIPIKFEIVHEDRIQLAGDINPVWGIPVLCRSDMFAEKLLANADRYLDISVAGRDIIDLAMMIAGWGDIPNSAWVKAKKAYGDSAEKAFNKAIELISIPMHLSACLKKLHMDESLIRIIPSALCVNEPASSVVK